MYCCFLCSPQASCRRRTYRWSPPPDAPKLDFATADEDGDGNISKQEAGKFADLQASFDLLDVDRNQALSPTEFARFSRAGSPAPKVPADPTTAPGGSAGAQHVPDRQ